MDTDYETRLLASGLASEIRKSPDHISITLTGKGILEFARAVRLLTLEEIEKNKKASKDCLYPGIDKYLIPKTEVLKGFEISHTTLWKWQKCGYLVPVKIGKRVYYKRDDIENLTQNKVKK